MATVSQLVRGKGRKKKYLRPFKLLALNGCPQKRGVCRILRIMTPRKPNSAQRKVVRVLLSNRKMITAYIPGHGHNLQEHSAVLVRGGRTKDLPGLRYKLMRRMLDFAVNENVLRKNGLTKYNYPSKK